MVAQIASPYLTSASNSIKRKEPTTNDVGQIKVDYQLIMMIAQQQVFDLCKQEPNKSIEKYIYKRNYYCIEPRLK